MRPLALAPIVLACAACHVTRPSELPRDEPYLVAVKSAGIPESMPWYTRFAEHTWVDVKCGDEDSWRRAEVLGESSGARCLAISAPVARRDVRWRKEAVRVERVIVGPDARRIAEGLESAVQRAAPTYANDGYEAWPGPNSNTFVRALTNELPELAFVFDHNAVGKDYAILDAGLTPSRTGVHLDTWPLGVAVGAGEGVEVHFLQLTLGVRVWPPRLVLPFLPPIPWEDTVETPSAASECPTSADHSVEMPAEDDADMILETHSTLRVACVPTLEPGQLVLVTTTGRTRWISMRVERTQPNAGEPAGGLNATVVVRGDERLDLSRHVAFDAQGKAAVGPFAVDDLRATLEVELAADGHLDAHILVERGRKTGP